MAASGRGMRDVAFQYIPRNPEGRTLYQVVAEQLESLSAGNKNAIIRSRDSSKTNCAVSLILGFWPAASFVSDVNHAAMTGYWLCVTKPWLGTRDFLQHHCSSFPRCQLIPALQCGRADPIEIHRNRHVRIGKISIPALDSFKQR
jgi:hypothetical protein